MPRLAARIIDFQITHLQTLLSATHEAAAEPAPGSPARADLDLIGASDEAAQLHGLRAWAHRAIALNMLSAEEHLQALRHLASADELLPLPAMSLGRSIYEAALNTFWLVQPDVSSEQRVARWAGRLLHDTQETPNALASFSKSGSPEQRQQMEELAEARAMGQRLMERAGLVLKAKGGDRSLETANVTYRGETATLTPKVTDLVPRFSPASQELWVLFSGASHSRGWLVAGISGDAGEIWTSIISPLLDTSDALVYEWCAYFGMDPRPVLTKTHAHRTILLNTVRPRSGSRAGLDMFRERGGLPALTRMSETSGTESQ